MREPPIFKIRGLTMISFIARPFGHRAYGIRSWIFRWRRSPILPLAKTCLFCRSISKAVTVLPMCLLPSKLFNQMMAPTLTLFFSRRPCGDSNRHYDDRNNTFVGHHRFDERRCCSGRSWAHKHQPNLTRSLMWDASINTFFLCYDWQTINCIEQQAICTV